MKIDFSVTEWMETVSKTIPLRGFFEFKFYSHFEKKSPQRRLKEKKITIMDMARRFLFFSN